MNKFFTFLCLLIFAGCSLREPEHIPYESLFRDSNQLKAEAYPVNQSAGSSQFSARTAFVFTNPHNASVRPDILREPRSFSIAPFPTHQFSQNFPSLQQYRNFNSLSFSSLELQTRTFEISKGLKDLTGIPALQKLAVDYATDAFVHKILPGAYLLSGSAWTREEVLTGLHILSSGGMPSGAVKLTSSCWSVSVCIPSGRGFVFIEAEGATSSLSWRPANVAFSNVEKGLTIYKKAADIGMLTLQGVQQFIETYQYVGHAVQTINPNIYFVHSPENGRYALSTNSGLVGSGSYEIDGGRLFYQGSVSPKGSLFGRGDITTTYWTRAETEGAIRIRAFQQTLPAYPLERLAVIQFPPGNYFDVRFPFKETIETRIGEATGLRNSPRFSATSHPFDLATLRPIGNLSPSLTNVLIGNGTWEQIGKALGGNTSWTDISRSLGAGRTTWQMPSINTNWNLLR